VVESGPRSARRRARGWVTAIALALGAGAAARPAAAQEDAASARWSGGGEIGIDARLFSDDGDPATQDGGAALYSRLQLRRQQGLTYHCPTVRA